MSARPQGLTRRLVLALSLTAMAATFFIGASSFVFYTLMWRFLPDQVSTADTWWPAPTELAWMALLLLVCPAMAAWIAARLARGILAPVQQLTECVRRLAAGELGVRAPLAAHTPGEIGGLLRDFNGMAERLQRGEQERATWNATIAHELRTPVTVLRGRLQGMADGVFTATPAIVLGLLQQTEGLSRLIDDLRVLSMADGGRLLLQPAPVALAQVLRTLLAVVEPDLEAAGFRLQLRLDEGTVVCDEARVRQVLLALLDNVRQHAEPGPVDVTLERAGAWLTLRVEDSGPGLDPAAAAGLFAPFARGQGPAGPQRSSGAGLGLAVVRAIAELHGGSATWRPGTRGGSAFSITLQLAEP
jgi:two-component system sensor histidine kinase AdeS